MPFTKYAVVENHKCPLPKVRDDGSALVIGDEWCCDVVIVKKPNEGARQCGKTYRYSFDQRDGNFWMSVRADNYYGAYGVGPRPYN